MVDITYCPEYLIKDGIPWFPIMGEFHYSRYAKQYWKESLYKMKAGGVDVVSTYIFWIHHEEIEGEYDFTENRNLREFVKAVKECGLYLIIRIGPWCHGECRNGGLPDWLLNKDFEPRTNDERYFGYVRKLYQRIFEQVDGYLNHQDGPIVGVQIENEYGHCGGLDGVEGESHMKRLASMAREIGYDLPIYTATGWGGAVTGGLVPVMGGYCEAPWDPRTTEIEPSGNYVFTRERNDHNIGSDFGFATGITFDLNKFPYLTAELGGGMQVTKHRRPIATASDIGAMSLVKLGSGVNLLGYYMYHGGTNPKGKLTMLQESKATGSLNDYPELSYDFNAPIKEYGQISETFKELKLYSMFIKDFGEEFCQMKLELPKDNPIQQTDLQHLRTSIRIHEKSGYVFVNNYQRHYKMQTHKDVTLQVKIDNEKITYPEITVADGFYAFYPFGMKLGLATLRTALATPLCILHNKIKSYCFYTNGAPCYDIEGNLEDLQIITLTREQAKNAYKVKLDQEYLILSDSLIVPMDHELCCIGKTSPRIAVYPDFSKIPDGFRLCGMENEFTIYEKTLRTESPKVTFTDLVRDSEKVYYEINLEPYQDIPDIFLHIHYLGESAKLYCNKHVIADNFYTGQVWEVGLKQFGFPTKLLLEIVPLYEGTNIYLEQWPEFKDKKACQLVDVHVTLEYKTKVFNLE